MTAWSRNKAGGSDGRPFVVVRGLEKTYGVGESQVKALTGVSLEVHQGELAVITGPSGCGKSSLMHIIGGLDRPQDGAVIVACTDLTRLDEESLARFRLARIGFVFQFHFLLPVFSALENAALPLLIGGKARAAALERAAECLALVGLGHKAGRRPGQLSGGEQQRVAIARALANNPDLLLADEPTGNLDSTSAQAVMALFRRIAVEDQRAVLVVSHNPQACDYATRTIHMLDGQIVDPCSGVARP